MKEMINKIMLGDARNLLPKIKENSIDLILTDPPYFLDKMDKDWDHKKVSATANYAVQSLPPGMKFSREQGQKLYKWYLRMAKEFYRVLKPGGFLFSLSSPRLYHRIASAIDDANFFIRDCFIWLYTQNQPKAMSLNHFIDKLDCNDGIKNQLKEKLKGWKTPQVKSCFEPIVMAQKEQEKTFLNNMSKYEVGLLNTNIKVGENGDMFPSNVMTTEKIINEIDKYFLVSKPAKKEKGKYNTHRTVKPLSLCEHIIKLVTYSSAAIVLDPFVGSGTTAVAAKKLGRNFIGIDTNPEYVDMALKRLEETTHQNKKSGFK